MKLQKISYKNLIDETLKLDSWYSNSLAKTTSRKVFYECDPSYLYLVSVDKYHIKYKRNNIYYIYLSNRISDKKGCYKTNSEKEALQLANDFYMQARLDLNLR